MKRSILIINALMVAAPALAQSSYTVGAIGSIPNPTGRTADAQAQSAATNAFLTTNPSSGRATVVDQGGGAFTIQTGDGSTYIGLTQSGVTRIVGSKGEPMNCVTTLGVTNCQ